jgi:iron complex outermembrane receptor protein
MLSAGLRHSSVKFSVDDHFLSNGNDSGGLSFSHTTPVAGVMYKFSSALHAYASAARGFETPTLNELFYSGTGGGFNFRLQPATSTHLEAGVKARPAEDTLLNAAVFEVRTRDEMVVDASSGGRTSYRNAGRTLRQGLELSLDSTLGHGLSTRLAFTSLRAVYDSPFGAVLKGSRLPGIPNANAYGELAWRATENRYGAALEALASSKVYAEDANTDQPAPGYGVLNARFHASQRWQGWRFKQFLRVNNLLDKDYIGSVIVGDTNKRYYEAAPQYQF